MRIATAEFGLVKSRPPGHSGNSVFSTSASSLNEGVSVFQVRSPSRLRAKRRENGLAGSMA